MPVISVPDRLMGEPVQHSPVHTGLRIHDFGQFGPVVGSIAIRSDRSNFTAFDLGRKVQRFPGSSIPNGISSEQINMYIGVLAIWDVIMSQVFV